MSLGYQPQGASRRYGSVSVFLHWLIAALVVIQLSLGWTMNEVLKDHSPAKPLVMWFHVSVGITILMLTLARLGVRVTQPAPPLPAGMPAWERALARATHVLFYMLLMGLPVSGWALVSMRKGPISWWGAPWPALPGMTGLSHPTRHALSHAHVYVMIWVLLITLLLHVSGALWHQFDGRPVLWRMGVTRRPSSIGL
ncbi:MAG TPA: cytochrome b [Caulobacteraceae bacterium]|jgi:cytochrome b561